MLFFSNNTHFQPLQTGTWPEEESQTQEVMIWTKSIGNWPSKGVISYFVQKGSTNVKVLSISELL